MNERGFLAINKTPEILLTPKERYDALKTFENAGGIIAKIKDEWEEFERRMQDLR